MAKITDKALRTTLRSHMKDPDAYKADYREEAALVYLHALRAGGKVSIKVPEHRAAVLSLRHESDLEEDTCSAVDYLRTILEETALVCGKLDRYMEDFLDSIGLRHGAIGRSHIRKFVDAYIQENILDRNNLANICRTATGTNIGNVKAAIKRAGCELTLSEIAEKALKDLCYYRTPGGQVGSVHKAMVEMGLDPMYPGFFFLRDAAALAVRMARPDRRPHINELLPALEKKYNAKPGKLIRAMNRSIIKAGLGYTYSQVIFRICNTLVPPDDSLYQAADEVLAKHGMADRMRLKGYEAIRQVMVAMVEDPTLAYETATQVYAESCAGMFKRDKYAYELAYAAAQPNQEFQTSGSLWAFTKRLSAALYGKIHNVKTEKVVPMPGVSPAVAA